MQFLVEKKIEIIHSLVKRDDLYTNRNSTKKEYVQFCIDLINNRIVSQSLDVEQVDPYEVYKDDEGYDYVFVA